MFGVKIKAVYLSTLHSVTDNDSHGNVVKYHALTSTNLACSAQWKYLN